MQIAVEYRQYELPHNAPYHPLGISLPSSATPMLPRAVDNHSVDVPFLISIVIENVVIRNIIRAMAPKQNDGDR